MAKFITSNLITGADVPALRQPESRLDFGPLIQSGVSVWNAYQQEQQGKRDEELFNSVDKAWENHQQRSQTDPTKRADSFRQMQRELSNVAATEADRRKIAQALQFRMSTGATGAIEQFDEENRLEAKMEQRQLAMSEQKKLESEQKRRQDEYDRDVGIIESKLLDAKGDPVMLGVLQDVLGANGSASVFDKTITPKQVDTVLNTYTMRAADIARRTMAIDNLVQAETANVNELSTTVNDILYISSQGVPDFTRRLRDKAVQGEVTAEDLSLIRSEVNQGITEIERQTEFLFNDQMAKLDLSSTKGKADKVKIDSLRDSTKQTLARWREEVASPEREIETVVRAMDNLRRKGRLDFITSNAMFKALDTLPKPLQDEFYKLVAGQTDLNTAKTQFAKVFSDMLKANPDLPIESLQTINEVLDGEYGFNFENAAAKSKEALGSVMFALGSDEWDGKRSSNIVFSALRVFDIARATDTALARQNAVNIMDHPNWEAALSKMTAVERRAALTAQNSFLADLMTDRNDSLFVEASAKSNKIVYNTDTGLMETRSEIPEDVKRMRLSTSFMRETYIPNKADRDLVNKMNKTIALLEKYREEDPYFKNLGEGEIADFLVSISPKQIRVVGNRELKDFTGGAEEREEAIEAQRQEDAKLLSPSEVRKELLSQIGIGKGVELSKAAVEERVGRRADEGNTDLDVLDVLKANPNLTYQEALELVQQVR